MFINRFIWLVLSMLTLVGCGSNEPQTAQGYIEGLLTYVSSSTSGYLTTLHVERGNSVTINSPLFLLTFEPDNYAYQAALDDLRQAKATKEDILAKLRYAEVTLTRNNTLYDRRVLEKSAFDRALSDRDGLIAEKAQADAMISEKTAQLASSKWTLSQKKISSSKEGIVYDVYYRLGEYISPNQPVLSILAPNDIKIIFYVQQPELSKIHLGAAIKAACDGCDWVPGKISFISPQAEYTPPLIFSNDTNSTLVYRIEATFEQQKNSSLHPGQPVTVKYGSH